MCYWDTISNSVFSSLPARYRYALHLRFEIPSLFLCLFQISWHLTEHPCQLSWAVVKLLGARTPLISRPVDPKSPTPPAALPRSSGSLAFTVCFLPRPPRCSLSDNKTSVSHSHTPPRPPPAGRLALDFSSLLLVQLP